MFILIEAYAVLNKLLLKWTSRKIHPLPVVFQLMNELSKMQSSLSEYQEQSQRQQQEMRKRLQEKEQTIKAQREQVSSHNHSGTVITSLHNYIERGSKARVRCLLRISCICYMGLYRHEIVYIWLEATCAFPGVVQFLDYKPGKPWRYWIMWSSKWHLFSPPDKDHFLKSTYKSSWSTRYGFLLIIPQSQL